MGRNPDTEDTHIYFPRKLLNKVRKLAVKNRRSMSAEVVVAVAKHVEDDASISAYERTVLKQGPVLYLKAASGKQVKK